MIADRFVSYRQLAQEIVYNPRHVAVVLTDQHELRMFAFAFGFAVDSLLPDCGQYSSSTQSFKLEVGSTVKLYAATDARSVERIKKDELHRVVFQTPDLMSRELYDVAELRCRLPGALGVTFLAV